MGLFSNDKPQDREAGTPAEFLTVRAYDEEHQIFHGYGNNDEDPWLGAAWLSPPLGGVNQQTLDKIIAAMKSGLPAGSVVQFGMLSSPDIEDVVTSYLANKTQDGLLGEMVRHHAEMMRGGVDNPIVPTDGILLNMKRLVVTLKVPAEVNPSPMDIATANDYCDAFEHALGITGMNVERMDRGWFLRINRIIMGMYNPLINDYLNDVIEELPLREQVCSPGDTITYGHNEIRFNDGSWYAKVLSTRFFPKYASLAGMNAFIGDPDGLYNQITDPYWLVTTIRFPDQVDKGAWMRSRASIINHQAFGPMMRMIPQLRYKKEGMDILTDEIDGKHGTLVEVNFTMVLYSRDRDNLLRLSGGLRAYFAALKFDIREDSRVLREVYNEFLPLNTTQTGTDKLRRFHTMGLTHACQFLPIIADSPPQKQGVMLLTTRRGDPAFFDLYSSSSNRNAVISATAGAGKSQLMQGLAKDYLAEGAKVWMVESGRSFYKFTRAAGGQYIEFNELSDISLNPFTHVTDVNDDMDHLIAVISKMASPNEGLSDKRRALLAQAISAVYGRKGREAEPNDVADFLFAQHDDPEANALGKQMYPFAKGHYAKWFNNRSNVNFNADLVAVELQDLAGRRDLQQVVLLQILSRIAHEMLSGKGRMQILMVDEAWELLDDPMAAQALEALYRKVRKYNGSVLIATQGIGDLYKSANTKAIVANSAWTFILKQTTETLDDAVKSGMLAIDEYGLHMLRSLTTAPGQYSEVMVRHGEWFNIYRYVAPRFDQVLFSTSGDARHEIMAKIDAGVDAVTAVNDFISQRG